MICVLVAGSLTLLGCGEKAVTVLPTTGESPAVPTGPHQVPAVVQPVAVPNGTAGDSAAVLAALTQAVRKYSFERRTMPKTFAEVVTAGYVRNVPPAPAGKKYEFDPKKSEVILVNQ